MKWLIVSLDVTILYKGEKYSTKKQICEQSKQVNSYFLEVNLYSCWKSAGGIKVWLHLSIKCPHFATPCVIVASIYFVNLLYRTYHLLWTTSTFTMLCLHWIRLKVCFIVYMVCKLAIVVLFVVLNWWCS